jgi:hypothetical protein
VIETIPDLREEAVRLVDRRHGYTCEYSSSPEGHRNEYQLEHEALIERVTWITPSGRRWSASPSRVLKDGEVAYIMSPHGRGYGGGVRAVHVVISRLDGFDKVWKPLK